MNFSIKYGPIEFIFSLKCIIVSIVCVSGADVLDDLGISFLHPVCNSYVCQSFFVSIFLVLLSLHVYYIFVGFYKQKESFGFLFYDLIYLSGPVIYDCW